MAVVLAACGSHPAAPPTRAVKSKPPVIGSAHQTKPWHSQGTNPYLPGDVLIADSHNNRILLVTPQKKIVWQFPPKGQASPLVDDDDVFFGPHFDTIITNEEGYDTVAIVNFKTEKVIWQYGHPGVPGSAPGYLNTPDDAFLYDRNGGLITVADIRNDRILFINRATKQIVKQYGETGVAAINPPVAYSAPNGDFPAPNQGTLVTQINGDDAILLNRHNQVVWTLHFPTQSQLPGMTSFPYPSDANFTPGGNVIVAFYNDPGYIVKMNPYTGQVLWEYAVTSGSGMLNQPSLAVELKNGMVMVNDDHNDRVIIINPKTNQIVWQYGHTGVPGSAPGYLNIPDGMDLLPIGVVPGGRNGTGNHLWSYPGNGL
jgi:outer membrane protein assembly factor BamB